MSISSVGNSTTNTSLAYLLQSLETNQTNQSSQTSQTSGTQGIGALLAGLAGGSAASTVPTSSGSGAGDSTTVSKVGQLYSELQQLQTQDPSKFQQVTAQIASQLHAASQQVTGSESHFLSNLSDKFQTASTTGSLASLLTPPHNHPEGTYNSLGQISAASALTASGTTSTSAASGTNLNQLFNTITQEVQQALGS